MIRSAVANLAHGGVMDIAFHSKSLRDACESEEMIKRRFGEEIGPAIMRRLADLRVAVFISDVPAGAPRVDDTGNYPTVHIELTGGYRMVLRVNHLKPLRTPDGEMMWKEVSRLKVMSIGRANNQCR